MQYSPVPDTILGLGAGTVEATGAANGIRPAEAPGLVEPTTPTSIMAQTTRAFRDMMILSFLMW
jgi:hypothetical protein